MNTKKESNDFIPHHGEPNAPAKRKLFITPLINKFNLAYALTDAFLVFILALGLTLVAAWILKPIHSRRNQIL